MRHELSDAEKNRLAELMHIGASTAADSLSRMIGKRVSMSLPKVFAGPPEKAVLFLGQTEHLFSAILVKVIGELSGLMMLLFPPESAAGFAALLRKRKRSGKALDEMDLSALNEAGNIAVGSALTAFSKFIDLRMFQSVPDAATDMLGSVVDGVFAELGRSTDWVLVFRIDLAVDGEDVEGMMLFLFDHQATETILEASDKKNSRS
jgi:chemotaxis protein CheC